MYIHIPTCFTCVQGHAVVEVLEERLTLAAESNESYELEDEYTAIREYLRQEMKKRGWVEEEAVVIEEAESCRGLARSESRENTRKDCTGVGTCSSSKLPYRSRVADRTGKDVLLSSEEEDSPPHSAITALRKKKEKRSGSIQRRCSYQSASGASCEASSSGSSTTSLEHRNSGAALSRSFSSRQGKSLYNPFGQADKPALISEERADPDMIAGAYPVIDHWLVDDTGKPPSKRRRKQARDPFEAGTSADSRVTKGSSSAGRSRSLSLKGRQGGSRRGLKEKVTYSTVSTRFKDNRSVDATSDSDDGADVELWSEACKLTTVDSSRTLDSDSHTAPHRSSVARHDPAAPSHQLPATDPQLTTTPASNPLPLRIRVKIDAKSYLIPCPAKLMDGSDSTIQWLAQQAAERYYTQQGVRPQLSLTTADGALLSTDDIVSHVLQSGEEVVGVVEQWHLPPLPQRYQTACSNAGHGEFSWAM